MKDLQNKIHQNKTKHKLMFLMILGTLLSCKLHFMPAFQQPHLLSQLPVHLQNILTPELEV